MSPNEAPVPVPPGVVIEEYMDMICWRLSVKADGRKSGKKRWMKEKTSTCPSGESGMMRMITKGTSVTRSLRIRRSSFTCNNGCVGVCQWVGVSCVLLTRLLTYLFTY